MEKIKVEKNSKLSKFSLENFKGLSFSAFRKALRNKDIKVNGKRVKEDVLLSVGDVVEIFYSPVDRQPFTICYQDNDLLVIDKNSGFDYDEVLEKLTSQIGKVYGVHRLDRNTSGLMLFALNKMAEKELLLGFKEHKFIKIYQAEVKGFFDKKQDVLSAYLVKDSENSVVKIFKEKVEGSVAIKTGYSVIEEKEFTSIIEVRLYTGKTHQIRAHFAYISHPLVGDGKYGDYDFNKMLKAKNLALRSKSITLNFTEKSYLKRLNNKTFTV